MKRLIKILIILLTLIFFPAWGQYGEHRTDERWLTLIQKNTFQWFLENSDPQTGLIADRAGSVKAPASIAGTGFGLTAYAIGVERGWISRTEAANYTLKVVKGLYHTPQGPEKEGVSGYHGYFYHFLDPTTGLRATPPKYWNSELSAMDTALLMAGIIFARNYYNAATALEIEIRSLCNALYERVDWPWLLTSDLTIGHGFTPESGKIPYAYKGYSEALLLYIIALSSKQHPIPRASWNAFIGDAKATRPAPYAGELIMVPGMPLFTYQYPMVFIDFRGIRDEVNRRLGFDYFENSRRATEAQWLYAQKNPTGKRGYDQFNWGFTASDGPANITKSSRGNKVTFRTYSERGAPCGFDDGTIAPTAAISSIIYTPEKVLATIEYWLTFRPELFNKYGFTDAFNPTFDKSTRSGWVDTDRLSIDQGPILLMIENFRTGLIWKAMSRDREIQKGLYRAGFQRVV